MKQIDVGFFFKLYLVFSVPNTILCFLFLFLPLIILPQDSHSWWFYHLPLHFKCDIPSHSEESGYLTHF